jgi:thioredoxin reductase (NADPH)
MEWRRLDADGFEDLLGRGAYYRAGRSEATQCGGDRVVVVGAGNSADQAAVDLAAPRGLAAGPRPARARRRECPDC